MWRWMFEARRFGALNALEGRPASGAGQSTPLRRPFGLPCGARFRRGPRKLASLKHARPFFRLKLRSSAAQRGSPVPHRLPGSGVFDRPQRLERRFNPNVHCRHRPTPLQRYPNAMLTLYNDRHALHHGKVEMFRGELVPCFEVPARADYVLQELEGRQLGAIEGPDAFDDAAIARIHATRYLDFLSKAWDEWVALDPANANRDALPSYWPIRTFRSDVLPASFPARMGLFSYDAGTPITAGTWEAARQG